MTDHSELKKRHPKAKVRNIKRLIAAIREMDHVDLAFERARINPPKINGRKITDAQVERSLENVTRLGKSKVPISFNMKTWIGSGDSFGGLTCGAAACICGVAGALASREPKTRANAELRKTVNKAIKLQIGAAWRSALAEFLGIDYEASARMSSVVAYDCIGRHMIDQDYNGNVEPRHAVKMLERFLETGKVDWWHAMGRNRKTKGLTRAEAKLRKEEARQLGSVMEEADAMEESRLAA